MSDPTKVPPLGTGGEEELTRILEWLMAHKDSREVQQKVNEIFAMRSAAVSSGGSVPTTPLTPTTLSFDSRPEKLTKQLSIKARQAQRRQGIDVDSVEDALAEGLEQLLQKIVEILPAPPYQCVVAFDKLGYHAKVAEADDSIVTVASQLCQMLRFGRGRRQVRRDVLSNLTGRFDPGTATLVLGPPRSGKSAFMKILAGRAVENSSCTITGDVTFNGQSRSEVLQQRWVSYISQRDEHIPSLTVRETVDFAKNCLTARLHEMGNPPPDVAEKLSKIDAIGVEIILTLLGIAHVQDTIVGNEMMRGVSGGQRKRVTTGEMLVNRTPVLLGDEISTGLDSASTYDICKTVVTLAHTLKSTVVISLLQPPPEVFELFDDVMLFDHGRIVYHGPRESVISYFDGLGYVCPPHKDAADFLQEVTTELGVGFKRPGVTAPRTAEEFEVAFRDSEIFAAKQKTPVPQPSNPTDSPQVQLLSMPYSNGVWKSFTLCLGRQFRLTLRNKAFLRARYMQCVIMGLLLGTLFYQMDQDNAQLHYGVMFTSLMFLALGGMASLPQVITERNIAYKHLGAHFFQPVAYALSTAIVQIPLTAGEAIIFGTLVYWLTGLVGNVAHYVIYLVIVFLCGLGMSAFFRVVAVVSPDATVAQSFASLAVLLLVMFCGFLITESNIKKWWIWVYWFSPLSYAFTSLSLNEYKASQYDAPMNATTMRRGDNFLRLNDITTDDYRMWVGIGYLGGFYLLMIIAFATFLKFLRWPETFASEPKAPDAEVVRAASSSTPLLTGTANDYRSESPHLGASEESVQLPFKPITLSFHDVSYAVDLPGEHGKYNLTLLNRVSGYAKPGTMTALMGSSGAGKTTLLDVLAGRKNVGKVVGDILLDGQPADPISFSRVAGYVEQMDIHSPAATVYEALRFSAFLRLPSSVPNSIKEKFVKQNMELLELTPLANTLIGSKGAGLSVEQAKRVTIGVELVANPSVIFLDEPTSGLDSRAATVVLRVVRNIVSTGRTVVCTIHQPSGELFSMFDNLLLLKKGGETVFFGALGQDSCHLINHLSSIPGTKPFETTMNPATWMLDVIGGGVGGSVQDFALAYQQSPLHSANAEELQQMEMAGGDASPRDTPTTVTSEYVSTNRTQFSQLMVKAVKTYWRSPQYNFTRNLLNVVIAVLLGSIYFQLEPSDQASTFSLIAVQFLAPVFLGVLNFASILPTMAAERAAFYRERAAHMYTARAYNAVFGFVELPYLFVGSLLFCFPFYFMVGLKLEVEAFVFWWGTFFLFTSFMTFWGMFLSVLLPNQETAQIIGTLLVSIWNQFCGFIVPVNSIPAAWKFLYYFNPLTYALQVLLSTQFYCEGGEAPPWNGCPTMHFLDLHTGQNVEISVWKYTKDAFGLKHDERYIYILILLACCAVLRIATYLALRFVNHASR